MTDPAKYIIISSTGSPGMLWGAPCSGFLMTLPRNAQIWLPGYLRSAWQNRLHSDSGRKTVWIAITDHYEPYWKNTNDTLARQRVDLWAKKWPEIAARHADSLNKAPKYSFFYPEEEYRAPLLEALEPIVRQGIGDVEIHLHHDHDTPSQFLDRTGRFLEVLHQRHGFLRKHNGELAFGFIHGNWALDNSLPDGRWCGLNNELTLLRQLGCYADFTLPSAPSPAQTRTVNSIYWAKDDVRQPKSHDTGTPVTLGGGVEGDLMIIQGPLAVRWTGNGTPFPRLETGELAGQDPPSGNRVKMWFDYAPRLGDHVFLKLFSHGTQEKNSSMLLDGGLDQQFTLFAQECGRRGWQYRYVTAWEMYLVIESLRQQTPLPF